jgi:uncharacterized membrane protein YbjE (DUF340 family)
VHHRRQGRRGGGTNPNPNPNPNPDPNPAGFNVLARSLYHLRLQPLSHAVATSVTNGYSLSHVRLQPPSRTVAGFNVLTRSLSREGRLLGAVSAPLLLSHFMVATFACVGALYLR